MRVINKSRVDFKYKASPESPVITKTVFSNIVTTTILKDTLSVKKYVDKDMASIYDILAYRIEIHNITDNNIMNLALKDCISKDIKFINNTVYINGVINRCLDPSKEIKLGTLLSKDKITITFKVVVCSGLSLKKIINSCRVTFDYIYNIEEPPHKAQIYSNNAITILNDNLFKQVIINSDINIPKTKGHIDIFLGIKTDANIVDTKIINCNFNSEMRNIIVIGSLTYEVYYIHNNRLCIFVYTEGFSTNLLVPKGVEYFKKIEIKNYKEDTSYFLKNESNLSVNTSLLIKI